LSSAKVVCVDRDGVINEDSDDYIKSAAEWHPIAGSLDAIAALFRAGFRVFVVSNQSGVGRGLFSLAALEGVNERMSDAVHAVGGELAGVYFCPHTPEDGCECRKPGAGLLRQIERDQALSLEGAAFVGDKWSDLVAARAVGARPILVESGRGRTTLAEHRGEVEEVYRDLAAAAQAIIDEDGNG